MRAWITGCAWLALAGCMGDDAQVAPLPSLAALPEISVSGVSAGAYMATQYHVAFSAEVDGAGLVAGGPWGCAAGDLQRALGACINGEGIALPTLTQTARELAEAGAIAPLEGLAGDRVFVFHGTRDTVVNAAVSAAAANWYRDVAPDVELALSTDIPAVHGVPTVDSGGPCDEFAAPYVNACGYDLAGEMMAHFLGELARPSERVMPLQRYDQAEFAGAGLAGAGYLYAPEQCRDDTRCRVHVFFHGCNQSDAQVGDALAAQAGFRRWAESNDIIVLFPQVDVSQVAPVNPLACWDWWGYSGDDYLEQGAPQLRAVRAMVRRLQYETP